MGRCSVTTLCYNNYINSRLAPGFKTPNTQASSGVVGYLHFVDGVFIKPFKANISPFIFFRWHPIVSTSSGFTVHTCHKAKFFRRFPCGTIICRKFHTKLCCSGGGGRISRNNHLHVGCISEAKDHVCTYGRRIYCSNIIRRHRECIYPGTFRNHFSRTVIIVLYISIAPLQLFQCLIGDSLHPHIRREVTRLITVSCFRWVIHVRRI